MRRALLALALSGCWTSSTPATAKDPAPPGGVWTPEPGSEPAQQADRPKRVAKGCDEVSCILSSNPPPCCNVYRRKPPPPPPPPPPGLPTLDRAAIQATIATVKPDVQRCSSQAATKGTMKVKVSVAPSGSAIATVQQSLHPAIDRCVINALGRARFPRTQSPTTFVYPFVF